MYNGWTEYQVACRNHALQVERAEREGWMQMPATRPWRARSLVALRRYLLSIPAPRPTQVQLDVPGGDSSR
jgi:hypothetical protein